VGETSFALLSSDSFRWREGLCRVLGETKRLYRFALISLGYLFLRRWVPMSINPNAHGCPGHVWV
jgi:hypothetical protein